MFLKTRGATRFCPGCSGDWRLPRRGRAGLSGAVWGAVYGLCSSAPLTLPFGLAAVPVWLRVRRRFDARSFALPTEHLVALAAEGVIGRLHPVAYSFVGACAQTPLTKRIAPRWVEMWKAAGIDGAVLLPV